MVFSSLTFLCVFLPVVFLLYYLLPWAPARNGLLIVASLLFYAYGEPVYVFLMIGSTVFNYIFGLLIGRSEGSARKVYLALSVIGNLAVLGIFKYAAFAVGAVDGMFMLSLPIPEIVLPIGISFFTFQAMSYCIDVYRKEVDYTRNYFHVLLYISFFPQLIAGPIVKYHDIQAQISKRSASLEKISKGMRRFCVGLGKKVLLANTMAVVADSVFGASVGDLNIMSAWLGAIAYMLQIYFDFSGYSDMAIGLGKMFGFDFRENFNYPYTSTSIKEFWRRWHISLSTWFRDYLYIPLGGNRKGGRLRTSMNKIIVFFTCGLWHGASWTFVVWGLYHGLFLLLEEYIPVKKLPRVLGSIYAILVVCVGFVVFRAESLPQGMQIIGLMFTGFSFTPMQMSIVAQQITPLFVCAFVVACLAAFPIKEVVEQKIAGAGVNAVSIATVFSYIGAVALLTLCMLELSGGAYNPFIYFRF